MHIFYPNIFSITKLLCNLTTLPFLTDNSSLSKIWKKDTFFPVGVCFLRPGLSGLSGNAGPEAQEAERS